MHAHTIVSWVEMFIIDACRVSRTEQEAHVDVYFLHDDVCVLPVARDICARALAAILSQVSKNDVFTRESMGQGD